MDKKDSRAMVTCRVGRELIHYGHDRVVHLWMEELCHEYKSLVEEIIE